MGRPRKQPIEVNPDGPDVENTNTGNVHDAKPVSADTGSGPAHFRWRKHPLHPDGPELDPMYGERTPAFVEWLARQQTK